MFSGSLVAIVTPMTADGSLDWAASDRLLDFHAREGTDGLDYNRPMQEGLYRHFIAAAEASAVPVIRMNICSSNQIPFPSNGRWRERS